MQFHQDGVGCIIEIPLEPDSGSSRTTENPAAHPLLSGRRVLMVEDSYFIALDVVRHMAMLGAECPGPATPWHRPRRWCGTTARSTAPSSTIA